MCTNFPRRSICSADAVAVFPGSRYSPKWVAVFPGCPARSRMVIEGGDENAAAPDDGQQLSLASSLRGLVACLVETIVVPPCSSSLSSPRTETGPKARGQERNTAGHYAARFDHTSARVEPI